MKPVPAASALRALWQGLAFFTILPSPASPRWTDGALKRAFLALPFVGLAIGLALLAGNAVLAGVDHEVRGACLTVLWLLLTGALHFDGLGDTADAALAATAIEERQRIAADPRVGSYALAAGASVLIVKFAALSQALPSWWLVVVPVLARSGVLPVAALHPSHAASRLGAAARPPVPAAAIAALAGVTGGLVIAAVAGAVATFLLAVAVALLIAVGLAGFLARRLGGLGGDAYGAIIEILEAALLILVVAAR